MFYSQFILAKKGPLGTIWIAAHLERKLRKNQVADTDISVSVDSILFPEVPIALRLSSHLLLGVVRIYSRKVNYLFNDCSEALVKIKQAFRSTAVDLPPEASTAPYHSITLPETFDLDDLELPDSSFCHGNFVDHHVTTREQITLQDPVEDSIYLGSQFGLDERFGDGDALQMGLDFDEDLFADRICSPGPSTTGARLEEDVLPSVPAEEPACSNKIEAEEQQSCIPGTDVDRGSKDEAKGHSALQSLPYQSGKEIDSKAYNVLQSPAVDVVQLPCKDMQRPDLNEEIFPSAAAQGPSTPGLIDEPLAAHVEEGTISSSSNRSPVCSQIESVVPAAPFQAAVSPTFCSLAPLSRGFEQVGFATSFQQCCQTLASPQLGIEQIKEVEAKLPVKEQVRSVEEQMQSTDMEPVVKEFTQHPIMSCTSEKMNSMSISSSLQVPMETLCEERPMLPSNLQSASLPVLCLTMPTVPSSSVQCHELNASTKQFPFQEFVASATTQQLTRKILNPQEVSMACLQQLNVLADVKQQLHLVAGPQQCGQLIQPAAPPVSSLSTPLTPVSSLSTPLTLSASTHTYELNESRQKFTVQEFPVPATSQQFATTISNTWDVSAVNFQQLNLPLDNKQHRHSASEPQECAQVTQSVSSPVFSLTMPAVPSTSGHCYELNACKQQLPIQEFPAGAITQQFATTISNTQDVSAVHFQQKNLLADNRHQLHSAAEPKECAQVIQSVSSPAFTLTMPMVPSTSAYSYELNVSKQQLTIQEFPAPVTLASFGLTMPMVPSTSSHSYELNPSKQQLLQEFPSPVAPPNFGLTMPTVPSTSTHSYELNATKQQLPIQEFPDAATSPIFGLRMLTSPSTSAHSSALNASKEQFPIPEFAASVASLSAATAISNKQVASTVHDPQLNLVADGKWESHSVDRPPEGGQVIPTDNSTARISTQDIPIGLHPFIGKTTMAQAFPVGLSSQQFNVASGCDYKANVAGAQQLPISVNTSELVKNVAQAFPSPQGLHVPETSGSVQGHLLQPCGEAVHQWQSFRLSASGQDSVAQGVQECFSKPQETAHILLSTEMQRIPTNAAPDFISSQSCTFPLPTGMQALSKGTPEGSILTQHCGLPLQAGAHGMPSDVSTENILFQDCGFPSPKIMESKGFTISVPARNMITSAMSQHQVNFNVSDELSNALSVSAQKNVTASKDEQSEAIESQPQTASFISQIPAHETLRSAFNAVREEPDSFSLKQQTMESETPREVNMNTIPTKQSIGKKRHIMDTIPVLNTPNSMAGSSFSNRSMDYLPRDDDVLASILGRTPAFKVRPSPTETVAPKRPRFTPRATVLKRKALIDVAMVLHGDVIRQQLVSTEDIRRVRKKAPCTRHETRLLEKESQAQQIFWEPSIPGLCMELCDLYDQSFGLNGVRLRHLSMNENSTETQRTQETRTSMEPTTEFRAAELDYVTLEQGDRPAEMVSVLGSGGFHTEDVSERQTCEATSKQCPGEVVTEMNGRSFEASKVTIAAESSIIAPLQPERVLDNIVAIPPQDNVCADCEVTGMSDPSVFQNGCKNFREINLTHHEPSVECKVGLDCLGANHEIPVENRGSIFLVENHEAPVENKNSSNFLFESHNVPVLLPIQDAVVEHVGEFREVNGRTELMNKESNAVINGKGQIDDIEVIEEAANNGTMEETLQENECKNQPVIDSETCMMEETLQENECKNQPVIDSETCMMEETLQEKECKNQPVIDSEICIASHEKYCLANIGASNGVIVDQNVDKLVETVGTCVQEGVVENIRQDDQVAVYEMPRELDHKTAEEIEAGSLVDKEALNEPTQEKVLATTQGNKATVDATTYVDDGERDDDFEFLGHSNNTEFLVADDETQVDADMNNTNVPNVEEDQIQENSGWSARTRAVSRYLKTVFIAMDSNSKKGEAESQRKLGLDRLLVGKTRKEAARMFFETLVLKTRDYVHVEQKNSFDDISIHPRAKLMKTNF